MANTFIFTLISFLYTLNHAFDFPGEASDFFMAAIFPRETAGQYHHCQGIGDLIFRHSVINADANTTD